MQFERNVRSIQFGKTDGIKARSHDPILRIRFLVPKIGRRRSDGLISRFCFCDENVGRSFVVCLHDLILRNKKYSIWRQNDHRDIMQNLSASFIFQMKIEPVLFPSVFFQNYESVCRKVIITFPLPSLWYPHLIPTGAQPDPCYHKNLYPHQHEILWSIPDIFETFRNIKVIYIVFTWLP